MEVDQLTEHQPEVSIPEVGTDIDSLRLEIVFLQNAVRKLHLLVSTQVIDKLNAIQKEVSWSDTDEDWTDSEDEEVEDKKKKKIFPPPKKIQKIQE